MINNDSWKKYFSGHKSRFKVLLLFTAKTKNEMPRNMTSFHGILLNSSYNLLIKGRTNTNKKK